MPTLNRFILGVSLLLSCVTATAGAQGLPAAHTQNGIRYVTGGIGEDESHAMLTKANHYSLRMLFAGPAGNHLSDVDVTISSRSGARLLQVHTEGPFLYVSLPAGIYRIDAGAGRYHFTRQVTIGARGSSLRVRLAPAGRATVRQICPGCPEGPAT